MASPKPDRRVLRRIPAQVQVSIKSPQKVSAAASTRDLSMSGLFLYTDAEIAPGNDLEMVLMLPPELTNGEKRWVCCQASVVRVEDAQPGRPRGVAVEIRNMATMPEITV